MFTKELSYIKNEIVRDIVEYDLDRLPDYFWTIPASTSGKYHPKSSLGEGGLVRHTKTAVEVAITLFPLYNFSDDAKDIIIASLILHDGLKCGLNGSDHTVFEHPKLMAEFVSFNWESIEMDRILIGKCIESHMGQWNTNKRSNIVLPLPESPAEKFVHMCDYIASRKNFNIDIGD